MVLEVHFTVARFATPFYICSLADICSADSATPLLYLNMARFVSAQAHRLWTIHAGGTYPCPQLNFTAFDSFYAAVYGLDPTPSANSVKKTFGACFTPWLNDETFITSVFALEELGAKGNKV
jgi:hypothetical protein